MRTFNIHEAKTQLSRLAEDVAAGEEIIIAKAGKPVMRLVPIDTVTRPRRFGALKGQMTVADDFDAPLPDEILDGFYGRVNE
jgi:prevent-host-death family protein